MDADFAKKWIADLRDPANEQCQCVLHNGVGYCCLGRAAVLAGATLVPLREDFWHEDGETIKTRPDAFVIDGTQGFSDVIPGERVGGEHESLTRDIANKIGMSKLEGALPSERISIGDRTFASLADANDSGCTFAQIADWIEAIYEKL